MTRELLTIELVPRTAWSVNVRSVVSPQTWARLRAEVAARAGHACEICGRRGSKHAVECHEVWAYDDVRHVQKLVRLVALCPACHEVKHIGLAGVRGRSEAALKHLARVNGWSMADARLYLEASYEEWHRRSNHKWTLDLSHLNRYEIDVDALPVAFTPQG